MKTVTLLFPDYDSMWQFKDKSKAINVRIEIRRNCISGLFTTDEVNIAVNDFQATQAVTVSKNSHTSQASFTQTKTAPPKFAIRSRLHQLLAMINL